MNKPTRTDYLRLRPKELLNLEHLSPVLSGMAARVLKTGGMRPRLTHPVVSETDEDRSLPRYFVPTGLLLFKLVRDPYMISVSRSQGGKKYWFNTVKRNSSFECPPDANQTLPMAFSSRLLWLWTSGLVRVRPDHEVQGQDDKHLQGQQFMEHVRKLIG